MIKIPGTPEGVPAIEQAIYEGINVNVTLLFSVEAYERVAEAYLRGARAPPARRAAARRQLGRELLRLARRHQRRPQARGARSHRSGGDSGGRQRPRRVPALQGDLLRSALGGAAPRRRRTCSVRCGPRPAPRTRATRTPSTSTRWSAPHTVNTMPLPTLLAVGRPRRGDRPDGRAGPVARTWRRSRRPGST